MFVTKQNWFHWGEGLGSCFVPRIVNVFSQKHIYFPITVYKSADFESHGDYRVAYRLMSFEGSCSVEGSLR